MTYMRAWTSRRLAMRTRPLSRRPSRVARTPTTRRKRRSRPGQRHRRRMRSRPRRRSRRADARQSASQPRSPPRVARRRRSHSPARRPPAWDTRGADDWGGGQRAYLLDPQAPSPSVEMLLHAFVPATFVDHTHATAVLSLIDQPNSDELCAEAFGGGLGFVPYFMPGFSLAKKAVAVFEQNPKVEGLILDKNGIFTFGETARESYERMIEMVTLAEGRLKKKTIVAAKLPSRLASAVEVAPIIRGACALRDACGEGAHRRFVAEFRSSDAIMEYVNGKDAARYTKGVITPDHIIRTKLWPLLVPAPEVGKLEDFKKAAQATAQRFVEGYKAYFDRNKMRAQGVPMHDAAPCVVLVPGLGLLGVGAAGKVRRTTADLAEAAAETITDAEAIGKFTPISETDAFDCEYWPLELAKLGGRSALPLVRQVAVVTGAAGAIGAATAKVFDKAGAEVALLDIDGKGAAEQAKEIRGCAPRHQSR